MGKKILVIDEQELQLLLWCVERHASKNGIVSAAAAKLPREDLKLVDIRVRLETVLADETPFLDVLTVLCPENIQDAVKRLGWCGDQEIAVAIWSEEDVMGRAMELRMPVTRDQVRWVVEMMDNKQDATLGITWDTIDHWLDECLAPEYTGAPKPTGDRICQCRDCEAVLWESWLTDGKHRHGTDGELHEVVFPYIEEESEDA